MRFIICIIGLAITIISAFVSFDLGHDDDLRRLFKSSHPSYAALERFYEAFSMDEGDFVILFHANDVLTVENLKLIQDFDLEVRALNPVRSVVSIFDARSTSSKAGYYPPLFPDLESISEIDNSLKKVILDHPLIKDVLLSQDSTTSILIANASNNTRQTSEYKPTYRKLQKLAKGIEDKSNLRAIVGGLPALQIEALENSKRDQLIFTVVGGLLGAIVAWLLLGQLYPFLVVFIPPLFGAIWTMGFLVAWGESFNAINTILPILVIIIGFTDSLHILLAIIEEIRSGLTPRNAIVAALSDIAPACVLTSITTAIAFASLYFSDSEIVQRFGIAGAAGVILNLLSVMVFAPIIAELLLKKESSWNRVPHWNSQDNPVSRLNTCLSNMVLTNYKTVAVLAIFLTAASAYFSSFLRPDHRYHENLPRGNSAHEMLSLSEEKFGGASPVRVLIEWNHENQSADDSLLDFMRAIREILEHTPKLGPVFSLETLNSHTTDNGTKDIDQLTNLLPPELLGRFINFKLGRAVVSANMQDISTEQRISIFKKLENQLWQLQSSQNDFRISLTGLHYISSVQGFEIINNLVKSLGIATILIFIVMTLAFSSLRLGIISVVPNVFPLSATAALLVFIGQPLQYASVLVFTLALGIAVDDTIHYLLRFKKERRKSGSLDTAISRTSQQIGFVIGTTTIILVLGMSSIIFSNMPTLSLFGMLSCFALTLALVGDMVFLPALLKRFETSKSK